MKKGVAYSLEALVAVTIVILTLVTLFSDPGAIAPPSEIKQTADEALISLDESGLIRYYVSQNDSTGLNNEIDDIMPVIVNTEAVICDPNCPSVDLPEERNIFISFYYLSGYPGEYDPVEIVLYSWEQI